MELLQDIPQASGLGPLVFNIYRTRAITPMKIPKCLWHQFRKSFERLEHDSSLAIEWFQNNYLLVSGLNMKFYGQVKELEVLKIGY